MTSRKGFEAELAGIVDQHIHPAEGSMAARTIARRFAWVEVVPGTTARAVTAELLGGTVQSRRVASIDDDIPAVLQKALATPKPMPLEDPVINTVLLAEFTDTPCAV